CDQAAFLAALNGATRVSFNCGMAPITTTLTSPVSIAGNVTIDGGGLVTLSGGGTTNLFVVPANNQLTLSRITVANGRNSAVGACGGAITVAGGASLTLDRTLLRNNFSGSAGGAVCVQSSGSANIQLSTFTKNQAGTGGAIKNSGSVTLAHSVLTLNTANTMGAGIQNASGLTVSDSRFEANVAGINGGGMDNTGTLVATNLALTGNSAGFRGGGLYNYLGQFSLTTSSVIGNSAGAYGGGVGNDEGLASTIDDTTLSGNSARGSGGGISNYRPSGASSGILTIRRSTIAANTANAGNTANNGGGGVANTASLTLVNSTVSGNQASSSAQGGGLYLTGGTADLLNDTLAGNSAGQGGNLHAAAAVTLKNTLLAGGSPNNCDAAATSQGHNLETANTCGLQTASGDLVNVANPGLGALAANGGPTQTIALLSGSPAIDAGTNTGCPPTDQRGVIRPQDGNGDGVPICDIGAFEASQPKLYLPLIRR
ncbi:MAG TPA: choice-of-anchor Q domain-containing protein, partial [Anaerolineae bacterium]